MEPVSRKHSQMSEPTRYSPHTPVPAGHDRFDIDHVAQKMQDKITELGISREEFLKLGIKPDGDQRLFNMTVLGIKTAHLVNGVSKLHIKVTEEMWKTLLEEYSDRTRLIDITSGVHLPTFLSGPMRRLYDKYLGEDWVDKQDDKELWKQVESIPDDEFWEVRLQVKKRLLEQIREIARQLRKNGDMGQSSLEQRSTSTGSSLPERMCSRPLPIRGARSRLDGNHRTPECLCRGLFPPVFVPSDPQ